MVGLDGSERSTQSECGTAAASPNQSHRIGLSRFARVARLCMSPADGSTRRHSQAQSPRRIPWGYRA